MKKDEYGTVINNKSTYKDIAQKLSERKSVLIPWTDEEGTQLDILFAFVPEIDKDMPFNRGIRGNELFVAILSCGAFGFKLRQNSDINYGYIAEKLNLNYNFTTEKLAELINGVINELCKLTNLTIFYAQKNINNQRKGIEVKYKGVTYLSIKALADEYEVDYKSLYNKIKNGKSIKKALYELDAKNTHDKSQNFFKKIKNIFLTRK